MDAQLISTTAQVWLAITNSTASLVLLLGLLYWLDNRIRSNGRPISSFIPNVIKHLLVGPNLDPKKDLTMRKHSKGIDTTIYSLPDAPSPLSLPLIGHIYLLAKYPTNPWKGFNAIREQYGDVVRIQLGVYRSIMVSSLEAIREVLLVKGDAFSNRPHFDRHAIIFGNNQQNALALCDWSDIHKSRRSIAHAAVIPRFGTKTFQRMSDCIVNSVNKLLIDIDRNMASNKNETVILKKERIVALCAAIFIEFLLEKEVDLDDPNFIEVCKRYDYIFYDINQMYLTDFVPYLKSITSHNYLNEVSENGNYLRDYINEQVTERLALLTKKHKEELMKQETNPDVVAKFDEKSCDERFVDRILLHKQYQSSAQFLDFTLNHYLENQNNMTWDECLYEIGDLVGGNSAVANLMARLLGYLAINGDVQEQIYEEVASALNRKTVDERTGKKTITLDDQSHMPLTNASIMETLRLTSSPIVPHQARWDTSIQGYFIPKDTMILFNIYNLNLNPDLWDEPTKFNPSRFVTPDGNVVKPDFFFPFSHGRRSCLGYKMVNTVVFSTVANLLAHYRLVPGNQTNKNRMDEWLETRGSIALPYDGTCFNYTLISRN